MDTKYHLIPTPALTEAIEAQRHRLSKMRRVRTMVHALDRRRQTVPVEVDRRKPV
jgi:hypothetical protein